MRTRRLVRLALAAGAGAAGAYAASRPTLMPWPGRIRPAVVGSVTAMTATTTYLVAGAAGLRSSTPPASVRVRRAAVATVGSAAGVAAVRGGMKVARQRLAPAGRAIEEGVAQPPTATEVSGGPGSLVDFETVGREGARFLHSSVPPEVIEEVSGKSPTDVGIRVFVGFDTAPTPRDRVDLALAELRRTGAYDRSHLLIGAPAGSGYANSTPVDVLEVLTGGDCAAVAVGYGLLPSFLSLDRVPMAGETQRLLIEGITADLAQRERRPRLLLYGESLGARVQEAAVARGSADLDYFGVDAALWVGTPGGAESIAFHAAVAGESITVDRPEQIPTPVPEPRPRVWFLEHDGDPVVRFRPDVAYRRPAWLAQEPRGRNVPEAMLWSPGITWVQVLVDTLFATHVRPGLFESRGHDYRADLGAVVTAAYDLPCSAEAADRLEAALRSLEIARAKRVGEA